VHTGKGEESQEGWERQHAPSAPPLDLLNDAKATITETEGPPVLIDVSNEDTGFSEEEQRTWEGQTEVVASLEAMCKLLGDLSTFLKNPTQAGDTARSLSLETAPTVARNETTGESQANNAAAVFGGCTMARGIVQELSYQAE
jgi:hypothetical protein